MVRPILAISADRAVGAQASPRVQEHGGLDLVRVAVLGLLAEPAALDRLEQRRPADHAGPTTARARGETGVGAGQPRLHGFLAARLAQGGLEGAGVDQGDQAADVPEAQRGQQARAHRTGARDASGLPAPPGQADGRARPDPEGVPGQRRVDHVEAGVAGGHAGGEDLGQARDLEQRGAALGVPGDRLLRDGHQRVALGAAQRARQAGV